MIVGEDQEIGLGQAAPALVETGQERGIRVIGVRRDSRWQKLFVQRDYAVRIGRLVRGMKPV